MSYIPPFDITSKMLNLISKIVEEITRLEISTPISLDLRKVNKIKTIAGTLQIEGNTLDEEKITAILNGKRVLAKEKDILEVKGAIRLYENLDKFDYKNIEDLKKAHKILMNDILNNAGNFRNKNVGVGDKNGVVHIAPPYNVVNDLMNKLFEWLQNTDVHPLIVSSVFHYEFEFIHPFLDGNGRIGRFWQTLILYNYKPIFEYLPIESIIKTYQFEYYEALKKSGDLANSTPFVEFMLEMILKTIQNVPKDDPKNVPNRESKLLDLIKENDKITIKELAKYFNVSDKTIKRDIEKLKNENKLKRNGSARKGWWEIL